MLGIGSEVLRRSVLEQLPRSSIIPQLATTVLGCFHARLAQHFFIHSFRFVQLFLHFILLCLIHFELFGHSFSHSIIHLLLYAIDWLLACFLDCFLD
jgi:hypothetical protein